MQVLPFATLGTLLINKSREESLTTVKPINRVEDVLYRNNPIKLQTELIYE